MKDGAPGALAGRRVLEIADGRGEYCGKLLADLGADVIKIEPPGGQSTRRNAPFYKDRPHPDGSLSFLYLNTNKRSVVLNLDAREGATAFERLAGSADLVLCTGGLTHGLVDFGRLARLHPHLVLTCISDFGLQGPWSHYLGADLIAHALGGSAVCIGEPDDPPAALPSDQAHVMASTYAAASSLAALLHAGAGGGGQLIDLSVVETVASFSHVCGAGRYLEDGIVPKRFGTGLVASVPSGAYPCRDGLIYLMVNRPLHWQALAKWINEVTGNREVLDPMFEGPSSMRQPHRELLDIFIRELTERFSVDELYREGQARHLAMTPVAHAEDLLRDPHLAARDYFVSTEHEHTGPLLYPGAPYRPAKTPWKRSRCAPRVGEHTAELLGAELGLSAGEQERASIGSNDGGGTTPVGAKASAQGAFEEVLAAFSAPHRNEGGPLAGIRVLEFTAGMAGPWIGRFMAWSGAEVIKVESRAYPDVTRLYIPPRHPELGVQEAHSPWFTDWNAGKRFVALDLTKPEAVNLCKQLAARADIVIENYSSGVLAKLGLDYAALERANPSLIMLSSTGYGGVGPYKGYVTWGPNIEALSSSMRMTGFAHRECAGTQYAYPDPLSAVHGMVAVLAALDHRRRGGEGQHIDMSQYEATVSAMGAELMELLANGRAPQRRGNRSLNAAPQGIYRCAGEDRWCAIRCQTQDQWERLCRLIGRTELAADPRFADVEGRATHADALDEQLEAWTRRFTPHDVMHALQSAGVPGSAVQDVEDQLQRDAQLAARGFFEEIDHKKKGKVRAPGVPLGFTATPGSTPGCGSSVGEHNRYVFGELLGVSDAEYARLVANGVIEDC